MNSNNKIIVAAIVIVVVIGIAYVFYAQPQPTQAPDAATDQNLPGQSVVIDGSTTTNDSDINLDVTPNIPLSSTVNYDGTSFSPASVTIKQGGTVSFKSSKTMWLASAHHPTHSVYDGTNLQTHCAASYTGPKPFDECSSGTSFDFMFNKTGSWRYHDHLSAGSSGTIVVVQ